MRSLPLALAVVAARAAINPGFPLFALAGELCEGHGLDAFGADGSAMDLRAVFASSVRTLTEPAARLFRLAGGLAGASFTASAAASLCDDVDAVVIAACWQLSPRGQ